MPLTQVRLKLVYLKDLLSFRFCVLSSQLRAIRKMLPAIISQFVTVIKDTSLLYSVIAPKNSLVLLKFNGTLF